MSGSASSSSVAALLSEPSRWATASESRSRASASEPALKIGRISAASRPCWSLRACPRQSLRKCTVQRCQAQPSTLAIAAFRPACASLIASWTPTRPRLTKPLRKSVQNVSVSDSPTSRPRISRRPVSCTPCAITSALLTTRPPSRTFSTFARSEEHTSELQSHSDLVCRLLLEKKKKKKIHTQKLKKKKKKNKKVNKKQQKT